MKAKFGSIVVDARGKIGGHVASKNRSGNYFRTKTTPVNPRSVAQQAARALLTTFSQGFRGLSSAQRAAWNNAVALFAKSDIFGDLRNPSGANLYTKLNTNLGIVGIAPITSPPQSLEVATATLSSFLAAAGAGTMTCGLSANVPAGSSLVIRATPPISPGVSFVTNKLRTITTKPAATASPINIAADYVAKYGSVGAAGQRIVLEVLFINTTTGVASARQRRSVIVAA